MDDHVDIFLWQTDLLEAKRKHVKRFDIGKIALPFQCKLVPCDRVEVIASGLITVPLLAGSFCILWFPFEYGFGFLTTPLAWGLGAIGLIAGGLFGITAVAGRRRQAETRIDSNWVEVTDRPVFRSSVHWREPLADYTGVRCHVVRFKMTSEGAAGSVKFAVHAIDLDHARGERVIPLLRADHDQDIERRWSEFVEALGRPKTGSCEGGLVKARAQGIPLRR